jgi:hypothetical protein
MFMRSRLKHRRLQFSLVDTNRVDGKVQQTHVATLGSVPPKMTIADRVAFWDQAHDRLARLASRLGKDGYTKIIKELRAKVPTVTAAERRKAAGSGFANAAAFVRRANLSATNIAHDLRLAQLSDKEFDEVAAETLSIFERASRAAVNKIIRRRQRSVTSPA